MRKAISNCLITAYFEEDAQEIYNNGLQSHSDDKNSHEGWACDQAREKIIFVINTTSTNLIEDLKEEEMSQRYSENDINDVSYLKAIDSSVY